MTNTTSTTNTTNTMATISQQPRITPQQKVWIDKGVAAIKFAEARLLVPAMHIAGIVPMVILLAQGGAAIAGIIPMEDFADWAEGIGTIAMWFFAAMLACTPFKTAFNWRRPLGMKKALALYAFAYTFIHMAGFFAAYDFSTHAFAAEALTSATMISGGLALLLMVPLAITSNKWSMKTMGRKWKTLHKLTYLIALLTVAHLFIVGDGGALAIAYLVFLAMRLPPVKRRITDMRKSFSKLWKQRMAEIMPATP